MHRLRCKERLPFFPARKKTATILLLISMFACGLFISADAGWIGITTYIELWIASYAIIYAGTCRYCTYFGKQCPIPLEGSMVHRFFKKKQSGFGYLQLLWATVVYLLRVLMPVIVIFIHRLYAWGLVFFAIFVLFWINHLWVAGCPHCINDECPLNPGRKT